MKRTAILGLGCLLLAGCPRNGGPPPEGSSGTPTASVPTPPAPSSVPQPEPPAPAPDLPAPTPGEITLAPGTYTSKACTGRKYERVARIGKGNTIELDDRVSPCPKDAACVWSGIVTRKGTYTVEKPAETGKPFKLVLTFDETAARGAVAAPAHLEWYESRGMLTEPGDTCPYGK